jgi:hypothetical protein
MRFWILLAALIGYHIPDVWDFLTVWKHYRPEYPGMVVYAIVSPGWLFFHSSLFVGLANAAVYGLIAYLVLLAIAKLRNFAEHEVQNSPLPINSKLSPSGAIAFLGKRSPFEGEYVV